MDPLVSICIPAYEQPGLLTRCLESISIQHYKNVEVVVTDDSASENVKLVCDAFAPRLSIAYHRNQPSLGTPQNWNAALDKASGKYSLLLHHDDWLATPDALSTFITAFSNNPDVHCVFGKTVATTNAGVQRVQLVNIAAIHERPLLLLEANKIGPPSNFMAATNIKIRYHNQYKWLVDVDYYIRILQAGFTLHYEPETLIGVGVHEAQTTNLFTKNPLLVLQEYISFAGDHLQYLKGWKLYDRYWRLVRNSNIVYLPEMQLQLGIQSSPHFIKRIIAAQKQWPSSWLRMGLFSKLLMWANYLRYGF